MFSSPIMQIAESIFTISVIMLGCLGSIALANSKRLLSSPRILCNPNFKKKVLSLEHIFNFKKLLDTDFLKTHTVTMRFYLIIWMFFKQAVICLCFFYLKWLYLIVYGPWSEMISISLPKNSIKIWEKYGNDQYFFDNEEHVKHILIWSSKVILLMSLGFPEDIYNSWINYSIWLHEKLTWTKRVKCWKALCILYASLSNKPLVQMFLHFLSHILPLSDSCAAFQKLRVQRNGTTISVSVTLN